MILRSLSVVACLFILQARAAALAQALPPPNTHDAAACAESNDRPICYLRLYSRWLITPLRTDPEFIARPELLKQIEGPNGENIRVVPRSVLTVTSFDPSARMNAALLQALDLDAQNVRPDEAIAPIVSAVENLPSRSFVLGQITTESGEELRIGAYEDILRRYRGQGPDDKRDSPSKPFVLRALAEWEKDVSRNFITSQYFILEYSRKELAKAYAELGDPAGAERALRLAGLDTSEMAFQLALLSGDIGQAIELTRADLSEDTANAQRIAAERLTSLLIEARKQPRSSAAEDVGRFFMELERQGNLPWHLLTQLGPGFPETLRPALIAALEAILLSPDTGDPASRDWKRQGAHALLIEFDLMRGDTSRIDKQIYEVIARLGACANGPGDACPAGELVSLLVRSGRARDLSTLLKGPGAETYLAMSPFQPFSREVEEGSGVPQTMKWMIEREISRGQFGMAQLSLATCARKRAKPVAMIFRDAAPDFDAALTCARRGIALSREPSAIAANEEQNSRFASYGSLQGRASMANMAIDHIVRAA